MRPSPTPSPPCGCSGFSSLESSSPAECPAVYSHVSEAGPETQLRQADAPKRPTGRISFINEAPCTLSCPVCERTRLRPRQTVCSGKCRAARWRRQQETTRAARDREIRELFEAALKTLEVPCGCSGAQSLSFSGSLLTRSA